MKHLLCFVLSTLAFLVTSSKKITIQIESEDLVNLFEGAMYSEVLQKFADLLVQRRSTKNTLNNPYHPEDELWNHSDDAVDKAKEIGDLKFFKKSYRQSIPKGFPIIPKSDPLEKLNEQFLNGNDVELTEDVLTEDELKPLNDIIKKHNLKKLTSNSTKNSTDEHLKNNVEKAVNNDTVSSIKDEKNIFGDDRAYFKPVQRRFVLKGSNDTDKPILSNLFK